MKYIKQIDKKIQEFALTFDLEIKKIPWTTTLSDDVERGHISTNCVFLLAKMLRKSPIEIGSSLERFLSETNRFKKIVFIKPGFINIFLTNKDINVLLHKETIEKNDSCKNKKLYLEYVSANPTGVLHLGHFRIGLVTKIYDRLVETLGAKTYKEFLVNDGGVQINTMINSIKEVIEGKKNINDITYYSKEMNDLAKIIKKDSDLLKNFIPIPKPTIQTKRFVVNYFLDLIKQDLKLMGIDSKKIYFIHEDEMASKKQTTELIDYMKKEKIAYEKDNAIFFNSSEVGDSQDRILIKSNGKRTYVCTDILYHKHKFETKPNYTYLNVWGADQQNNENKMRHAFKLLKDKRADNIEILYAQMVHLKKEDKIVKMSKRDGTLILVKDVNDFVPIENLIHYLMSKSITTTIAIDIEQLKKNDKTNTLYYLQYSYARIHQLLKKAKEEGFKVIECKQNNYEFIPVEVQLILTCAKIETLLNEIAKSMEVHKIYTALHNVCELFHSYYQNHKILDRKSDREKVSKKLELIQLVERTIKTLFDILDIETRTYMS